MRLAIPLAIADLSNFARSLEAQLNALGRAPKHVEVMNMLARGAGYTNVQHLRASMELEARLKPAVPAGPPADLKRVARVGNYFADDGMLMSWPAKPSLQELALWVLWSRLPANTVMNEREISRLLAGWHAFGDHALLRRAMWGQKLVSRNQDGSEYRRIEQAPPPELTRLLAHLNERAESAA